MKTISNISMVFFLIVVGQSQAQQATITPSPTPYSVIHRDAYSRIWEQTTYERLPSGKVIPHLHHYTELATGLCYKQNGQWVDSQAQITILPDGTAAATNGQHQAYFPSDIYNGVITLVTPDGLRLQSRPVGLSYDDGTNTVLIAELTNSVGQLISSNQVIYTNAFVGISADLLYTYRIGGFEQDVVFRGQPPMPDQLGMDPSNSRMQMLTEFFDPPTPVQSTKAPYPQDGLRDATLDFGKTRMIQGNAFLMDNTSSGENPVHIYKSWTTVEGRNFLIEEVPFERISSQLATLPARSPTAISSANSVLHKLSSKRLLPPTRIVDATTNSMRLASASLNQKQGLVFDYVTLNSDVTNYTFQGDTTYYINNVYGCWGTTTFEGGSIIKFSNSGQLDFDDLDGSSSVNCDTGPYRPAIFTSKNDNSIGDNISGSSGSPSLSDVSTFLYFLESEYYGLQDLRFIYCSEPIISSGYLQIQDCQFDQVTEAINGQDVVLINVLINSYSGMNGVIGIGSSLEGVNLTVDSLMTNLVYLAPGSSPSITLLNCLWTSTNATATSLTLTNNLSATVSTDDVVCLLRPASPVYQTVGAGSYYLANNSPYRNMGTTNLGSYYADLIQKTTYPPIVYSNITFSVPTTLSPQAQRDNAGALDLGYHYDPLDYVLGGCDLYTNLAFSTGTAVGWFQGNGVEYGQPYAISLENGANLSFRGNATLPSFFANYAMVQEGKNGNWTGNGYVGAILFNGSSMSQEPILSANFSKWTYDGNRTILRDSPAYGSATFQNSEFYNLQMSPYDMQSLCFSNCLLFRDLIVPWDQDYDISFTNENCTYYNGGLVLIRVNGQSSGWQIENTTFDGTALSWNDDLNANPAYTIFNYNAYNTNNLSWQNYTIPYFTSYGTNEVVGPQDVMADDYNWQSSWFGDFYLPSDSPLIQAGSTTANLLGLYHFTTQVDQTPETNAIVDIGYHYVATDGNGNPLDSNGDGIPDYIEDANGNGLVDSGEIGWNIPGDLGLKVIISQPRNGSVLP